MKQSRRRSKVNAFNIDVLHLFSSICCEYCIQHGPSLDPLLLFRFWPLPSERFSAHSSLSATCPSGLSHRGHLPTIRFCPIWRQHHPEIHSQILLVHHFHPSATRFVDFDLCAYIDGVFGGMAVEAVEVEVGFDRRGRSEFAQGANVIAWEHQVSFFFFFIFWK